MYQTCLASTCIFSFSVCMSHMSVFLVFHFFIQPFGQLILLGWLLGIICSEDFFLIVYNRSLFHRWPKKSHGNLSQKKTKQNKKSPVISSLRKIWKSTLMSSLERKPGQSSWVTAITERFFPACWRRKRTSFYGYQEKQHKQMPYCSVILMELMMTTWLFWRKQVLWDT